MRVTVTLSLLLGLASCVAAPPKSGRLPAASAVTAEVPDPLANVAFFEVVRGAPAALPGEPSLNERGRFAGAIGYAENTRSWALLIWQGGRLRLEEYRNGANAGSRPLSVSLHKTVFAMLVGHAIDDGLFAGLDAPIGAYLQEWEDDPRGRITLRQFLTMTTGLTTLANTGDPDSEWARFERGDGAEAALLDRRTARPAGQDFEYLNVNTNLIGLALQRRLDGRYAEYLSEKIWKPIGAGDAYVTTAGKGGNVIAASNLMASARDWLRIGLVMKDDGMFNDRRVLPEGWMTQMLAPSARNPIYGLQTWRGSPYRPERYYNDFGTGLMVKATAPFPAEDMVYLDGYGGQRVYVSRSLDVVIVRLGPTTLDWDDSMLPNLVVQGLR